MATTLPAHDVSPALARDARFQGLATRLRALDKAGAADSADERGRQRLELREASRDFEAMFINLLLREMRPKEKDWLFGNGPGSEFYREMFDAELSKVMSRTGQLGLAELIEKQVASRIGLDDEEDDGFIPARTLGRPLPQPLRRSATRAYSAAERTVERAVEKLLRPAGGHVSSPFGLRTDPFDGTERPHKGVDFAAAGGSPIRAAAPGRVTFSGLQPGYGNVVVIEHAGGYETRYAHNANNLVRKGEIVKTGQVVASVGSTGRSTGPHLHFEVLRDGAAVDPMNFIR